jgi:hypothetical protein
MGYEKYIGFWPENLPGRGQLKDLGIYGETILEWILGEKVCEGVDWIHLIADRDQCASSHHFSNALSMTRSSRWSVSQN